ncbi:MAG: hypothetical protein NTX13_01975 [Acidobacteria bacterium]|nr:hypothetical protein [Acidobacteriota bacterium]
MIYFPFVVGAVGSIIFLVLLSRLSSGARRGSRRGESFDPEWFETFSAFRYLPMRRLLNGNDEAYLQGQNLGCRMSLRAFRAERRQLFRIYLEDLRSDFYRLSLGAKQAILNSADDHSHHVETLLSLEWRFQKTLWRAKAGLVLHACGWSVSDASDLIDVLQHFEFSLREAYLAQNESAV